MIKRKQLAGAAAQAMRPSEQRIANWEATLRSVAEILKQKCAARAALAPLAGRAASCLRREPRTEAGRSRAPPHRRTGCAGRSFKLCRTTPRESTLLTRRRRRASQSARRPVLRPQGQAAHGDHQVHDGLPDAAARHARGRREGAHRDLPLDRPLQPQRVAVADEAADVRARRSRA
eukprot:3086902-Prymnesium_polylepis.2